ncbi:MAG: DUF2808 domain-containing protein [Cyanobacteria bacterium P01_A01_bin.123]
MRFQPFSFGKRVWAGLAVSTLAVVGVSAVVAPESAQAICRGSGFTIFGGVDPELVLPYRLCNNEPRSGNAVYQLEVPGDRIIGAIIEIEVNYNPIFTSPFRGGRFNIDEIEVVQENGDRVEIDDVIWDEDGSRIEIYPTEPIPAATDFTIMLNDVYNPSRYQQNLFNLKVLYQGEPLRRTVGTWPLEISADD